METTIMGAMIMEVEATLMVIMDMTTIGMRLITLDMLHAQLE